ncbi:MAG: hypothetical protein HYS05_21225 [Acidobacteria bacterium]|nr:hypothetical protein [Acidobacteriota bacterium]
MQRDFHHGVLARREFLALVAGAIVPLLQRPLPPTSWTCPMHAEVVDNESGTCPICKMDLVPVKLDLVWSCAIHVDVTALHSGNCRICRRELVRVVKALSFTCPVHAKVEALTPGRCPRCKRTLVAKYSLRPHGNHNPKHGGIFVMAPNNWHVEVTHPSAGLFRLYVYDDYSRTFIPRGFTSRIMSVPGRNGKPADASIPFTRGADYLVARVPRLGVPASIVVKVRFQTDDQEYRFDFPFVDYSKEPR